MNIHLIQGEFSSIDAIELITNLIHTKIKYHENKILKNNNEEDIKSRESKIKRLQNELSDFRIQIGNSSKGLKMEAIINIE